MRVAILAHDRWIPGGAKTGMSVIRYLKNGWTDHYRGHGDEEVPLAKEVVAVLDRARAGSDAGDVTSEAAGIPVVASFEDAVAHGADALVIGIAPVGGALPEAWRADVAACLRRGFPVVSGLHTRVSDDPEFARLAKEHDARIVDVRHLPREKRIATGEAALVEALVVTMVGTECGAGKMTTAIELTREARARGINAAFVATGQTGLMVGCDAGLPIDATISDFAAGAMEEAVLNAARGAPEIVFVEGQGALSHPAYSGVTLSLLHGSWPDVLVMCDEPARASIGHFESAPVAFPVNRLAAEIHLNEACAEPLSGARVAALSLMTRGLDDKAAARQIRLATIESGRRGGDVFRGGAPRILDAVLEHAEARGLWKDGYVKGVKAERRGRPVRSSERSRAA